MSFNLPDLPYPYDALEPYIDVATMFIHHTKHHAGYTNKLNDSISKYPDLGDKTIEELLGDITSLPSDIQTSVRNNGGGYYNHSLFWKIMSPNGGGEPSGDLMEAITSTFGSFVEFRKQFSHAANSRFGSGWAWLIVVDGNLKITSTPNQDNPLMKGLVDDVGIPILGLDVWEHAYYLRYQNRRPAYVENWWNVVNWDEVAKRFKDAL